MHTSGKKKRQEEGNTYTKQLEHSVETSIYLWLMVIYVSSSVMQVLEQLPASVMHILEQLPALPDGVMT